MNKSSPKLVACELIKHKYKTTVWFANFVYAFGVKRSLYQFYGIKTVLS